MPTTRRSRTGSARSASSSTTRMRISPISASTPTRKIVEIPKPAGVDLRADAVDQPGLLGLLQGDPRAPDAERHRHLPPPYAKACCADAARLLARAAEQAGAPDGVIQVIDEPSLPIIDAIMKSDRIDLILATGGSPMVRAAYSSGNPAIGVGPGNNPAYVDESADVAKAAKLIADSKAFDNSILCTNESAVIAHAAIARRLAEELKRQGCHMLSRRGARPAGGAPLPGRQVQHLARRQVGRDDRRERRHPRAARHARAARSARADRRRLSAEPREALPGARLLRGGDARGGAHRLPRHGAPPGRRPFRRDPCQRPGDHPALRGGDERAADRGECRLLDRRGRVRHVPRADHDDRHRLFRPLVGRRERRPAALVQWTKIAYDKRRPVRPTSRASSLPEPPTRPRLPQGEIDYSFNWVGGRPSPIAAAKRRRRRAPRSTI